MSTNKSGFAASRRGRVDEPDRAAADPALPGKLFSGMKGLSRVGAGATMVGSKGLSTAAGGGRRLAVGTGRTAKKLAGQAGGMAVEGGKSALPLVGQAGGLLSTALRNEQVQEVGFALVEGFLGPRASALVEKAAAARSASGQGGSGKKAPAKKAPAKKAIGTQAAATTTKGLAPAKKAPAKKATGAQAAATTTKGVAKKQGAASKNSTTRTTMSRQPAKSTKAPS
jgi:hypothetical protein